MVISDFLLFVLIPSLAIITIFLVMYFRYGENANPLNMDVEKVKKIAGIIILALISFVAIVGIIR